MIAHRPALADKEKADRQQTGSKNSGPYLGRGEPPLGTDRAHFPQKQFAGRSGDNRILSYSESIQTRYCCMLWASRQRTLAQILPH